MNLTVNGEARTLPEGTSVASLLENLGIKAGRVAVEVNMYIVPKASYVDRTLQDGDRIEVVHFVGGG